MLDFEVVFGGHDVLVRADLRRRTASVLDLDFEVERCDAIECDGYHFFTVGLAAAVAVGFAWVVEASGRSRVDSLLNGDGSEMLL